jgi:hypothetical protein
MAQRVAQLFVDHTEDLRFDLECTCGVPGTPLIHVELGGCHDRGAEYNIGILKRDW